MESNDIAEKILEAYSNPTKMKIIFLLTEDNEMTVTQMASHLNMGRSNLYHFVKQMVADHILSEPIVRPKLNYVEKYYKLNTVAFEEPQQQLVEKKIGELSNVQARSMLSSYLAGAGGHLMMLARKVAETDDEMLEKLGESFLNKNLILQYISTYVGSCPKGEEYLKKAAEEFSKPKQTVEKKDRLRTLIVSIPFL